MVKNSSFIIYNSSFFDGSPQGSPDFRPQTPQTTPSFCNMGLLEAQDPRNSPPLINNKRTLKRPNAIPTSATVTSSNGSITIKGYKVTGLQGCLKIDANMGNLVHCNCVFLDRRQNSYKRGRHYVALIDGTAIPINVAATTRLTH